MKVISTQVITSTSNQVTKPGYLIDIELEAMPLRLSTIGEVSYNGMPYSAPVDLQVSDLRQDGSINAAATITIVDATQTYATIFLGSKVVGALAKIYAVDKATWAISGFDPSTTPDAAVEVFAGFIGAVTVDDLTATVQVNLVAHKTGVLYAPRRLIAPENGFNYLIEGGTELKIGNQTYILERK